MYRIEQTTENTKDAGIVAAAVAEAAMDWAFEDEQGHTDASHITETGREAFFILTLANGQRFRVAVTEVES